MTTCCGAKAIAGEGHLSGVGGIIVVFCRAGSISFPCGRLRAELGDEMVPVGTVEGVKHPR